MRIRDRDQNDPGDHSDEADHLPAQGPDSIEGLINLRGTVIPIVSLEKAFRPRAREFDDETRTVVVNSHRQNRRGPSSTEVTQVMKVAADQIQPVPISVTAIARRYISGLAQLEDRLLIILDIDKLFDPRRPRSRRLNRSQPLDHP